MRGERIREQLFQDENETTTQKRGQGRSKELLAQRNEMLLYRYYYYEVFTDKRYDSIIKSLMDEFCIAEFTITRIISDGFKRLKAIKKDNPSLPQLAQRYNHLKWPLQHKD